MSLHSRGATSLLLDALRCHPAAGVPILHWFSGTKRELALAVEAGCWFSVGPAMLAGAKGQKLAAAMPRNRILTETDGPFACNAERSLMPWDVLGVERELAMIWECSLPKARATLLANFRALVAVNTERPSIAP